MAESSGRSGGEFEPSEVDEIARAMFAGSAHATDVRRLLLEIRATPNIDFYELAKQALELTGDETVLEVGTGSGYFIEHIAMSGHRGRIIGIDLAEDSYSLAEDNLRTAGYTNVEFREGNAMNLPLKNNSVDAAVMNYVLYHVGKPHQALRELQRVVTPGGAIVFNLRGSGSWVRHYAFAGRVTEELGFMPPKLPYDFFDADSAVEVLRKYFITVPERSFPHDYTQPSEREVKLRGEDWHSYEFSLREIISSHIYQQAKGNNVSVPSNHEILDKINQIVRPVFFKEIYSNINGDNTFRESADERLITCINDKA